jgi:sodium pump decarboxylase gamma subunit
MENIIFGLGVTALGMITVFAGLVILILFLKLLGALSGTGKKEKKKTPAKAEAAKTANAQEVPGEVLAAITAALAMNNEAASAEVVAAISAALTMVMGGEKFVVRHVKRIHNAPAWNRAGREEQTYSRF